MTWSFGGGLGALAQASWWRGGWPAFAVASLAFWVSAAAPTQAQPAPPAAIEPAAQTAATTGSAPLPGPAASSAPASSTPAAGLATRADGESKPAVAPAPSRPGLLSLRYDEDWSSLAEPSLRRAPLDPLKYISLGAAERYLSLGGELRIRGERVINPGFGAGMPDDDGYVMERSLAHADLHLGPQVRIFTQLQSSLLQGRVGGPRFFDRDELDLHQAFFELRLGQRAGRSLVVRLGRQEIEINFSRLFSARDSFNTRLTFDAARAFFRQGRWELVAMAARPVVTQAGIFDNDFLYGRHTAVGLQLVRRGALLPEDALVVHSGALRRLDARFDVGQADATRWQTGVRWSARRGALDLNYELVGQVGTFGEDRLLAWDLATDTGWTRPLGPLQLRTGVRADITSGDSERGDDVLGNFEAAFPGSAYSGLAGLIGPSNAIDLAPQLTARLPNRASVTAGVAMFWRYSDRDGIYTLFTSPQRTGVMSDERFIGAQFTVIATLELLTYLQLGSSYSYFSTGAFLEETPPAKDTQFATVWATARF